MEALNLSAGKCNGNSFLMQYNIAKETYIGASNFVKAERYWKLLWFSLSLFIFFVSRVYVFQAYIIDIVLEVFLVRRDMYNVIQSVQLLGWVPIIFIAYTQIESKSSN